MERSEKRLLIAISIVLLALIAAAAIFVFSRRASAAVYAPPEFDPAALAGVPEAADEAMHYGSLELPISEGRCVLSAAATPSLEGGMLNVFLTSDADNTVYIRIIIYGDDGSQLGASGLLRPGEYVQAVSVSGAVASGSTLTAKLLTYEPETYYSMGSASVSLLVR